jgi:hypothetical protein
MKARGQALVDACPAWTWLLTGELWLGIVRMRAVNLGQNARQCEFEGFSTMCRLAPLQFVQLFTPVRALQKAGL